MFKVCLQHHLFRSRSAALPQGWQFQKLLTSGLCLFLFIHTGLSWVWSGSRAKLCPHLQGVGLLHFKPAVLAGTVLWGPSLMPGRTRCRSSLPRPRSCSRKREPSWLNLSSFPAVHSLKLLTCNTWLSSELPVSIPSVLTKKQIFSQWLMSFMQGRNIREAHRLEALHLADSWELKSARERKRHQMVSGTASHCGVELGGEGESHPVRSPGWRGLSLGAAVCPQQTLYQAEGKWAIGTAAGTTLLCGGAWPGGRAEPGPWQELSGLALQSQALAKVTHTKLRLGGSSSQDGLPKSRSPEKGWFCSSGKPVKQKLFVLN